MPGPTANGNGVAAASTSAATKEAEAAKRARRRAAQKANKKALREADQAQQSKFAAIKKETAATGEEGEDEGDEQKGATDTQVKQEHVTTATPSSTSTAPPGGAIIEYIPEEAPSDLTPALSEFSAVFARFQKLSEAAVARVDDDTVADADKAGDVAAKSKEERIDAEIREQTGEAGSNGGAELSRRKQKERDRLAIADLKQLVAKPDVVELHDANSADPKLLVYLKSYRNTVPVPQHWSQKRKYLQNKRGYEKAPFQLPTCIENTGISKMRGAQQEKEATQTNKQQQRKKMAPKMGKIDIDYQILHDAFFRYQTKPPLTEHGALYYEGREHEVKMTEKKPGQYSQALREALGMKDATSPPPWLLHMQRVGPPPAYPHLAIPGVSAPIPTGARYGFGEGEWGKPPVDQQGRPLYGDVFGVEKRSTAEIEQIDTTLWGALESEEEEEEEEEEQEQEEESKEEAMDETPQGVTDGTASTMSTMSGLTTPEILSLRKADGTGTETPDTVSQRPKNLYTVLEEKRTSVGAGVFGTQHTYVLPTEGTAATAGGSAPTEQERRIAAAQARQRAQVDVTLNPEELEGLDAAGLKRKYERQLQEQQELGKKALTADEEEEYGGAGSKLKKRKKGTGEKDKAYKDFKF